MVMENFGKVCYVRGSRVAKFVDYLKEGKLMATVCKQCGKLYFPPRSECIECLGQEMDWKEISGNCKVLTYTTLHFGPAGFDEDLPYTIVLVELDEGAQVLTRLSKDVDPSKINVGSRLKLRPVKLAEGKVTYEATLP